MGLLTGRHQLSRNRLLVCDVLHYSRKVPSYPLARSYDLGNLAKLRQSAPIKVAWPVLFLKAYGLVAADHPPLRQTYIGWPWDHVYEHPFSVGALAMSRTEPSGDNLYWGRFIAPETQLLVEMQSQLEHYKTSPTETTFRRQQRFSRLPTPVRRLAWWLGMNVLPHKRAKHMGTFSLSTLASFGATNCYHPSPLTTSLTYGPMDAHGQVPVTLLFDHRVMDGARVARALADLEAVLHGPITRELEQLHQQKTWLRSA
jgi:hypothetical protein